jgi:hypothetical protein
MDDEEDEKDDQQSLSEQAEAYLAQYERRREQGLEHFPV